MLLCFLLVQKLQNLSEDTTDSAILPQQSRDSFAIADFYPSNFLLIQQENGLPRFLSTGCRRSLGRRRMPKRMKSVWMESDYPVLCSFVI